MFYSRRVFFLPLVLLITLASVFFSVGPISDASSTSSTSSSKTASTPILSPILENSQANTLLHLRLRAILLSDDDGSNAPGTMTVEQLLQWVADANRSFSSSNAQMVLDFNPNTDLEYMRNSGLNRMDHDHESLAGGIAAGHAGELVIFFRAYNAAGTFNGNGYASFNSTRFFIVLPSNYCGTSVPTDFVGQSPAFSPTGLDRSGCQKWTDNNGAIYLQNYSQMAHDIGHFLGLAHTFPGAADDALATPRGIQDWYVAHTRSINDFDGDAVDYPEYKDSSSPEFAPEYAMETFTVTDTPADAGAHLFTNNHVNMCHTGENRLLKDPNGGAAAIVFNGPSYTASGFYLRAYSPETGKPFAAPFSLTFTPDKGNVMSYFLCSYPMTFSPGQVAVMRRNLMTDPQRNFLICQNPDNSAIWSLVCSS